MITALRRTSHIGQRPVVFDHNVTIRALRRTQASRNTYKTTGIRGKLLIRGPLGGLQVPLHKGMAYEITDGVVEGEKMLRFRLDKGAARLTKPQVQFVKSMWGTIASMARNHVTGVTEVKSDEQRFMGFRDTW